MSLRGKNVTLSDSIIQLQGGITASYVNIRCGTIRRIILPDSIEWDAVSPSDQLHLNQLRRSGLVIDDPNRKRRRDRDEDSYKRIRRDF